jgi:hypothetical protein
VLSTPIVSAGDGADLAADKSAAVGIVDATGAPQPAVGVFNAVQADGSGAAVPPVGSTDTLLLTVVPADAAIGLTAIVNAVFVPVVAAMLPAKVQMIWRVGLNVVSCASVWGAVGAQVQPVPPAVTKSMFAGISSLMVAVVATPAPLLLTVMV